MATRKGFEEGACGADSTSPGAAILPNPATGMIEVRDPGRDIVAFRVASFIADSIYTLTGIPALTPQQVLEAHKGQPRLEKRFEQLKTVHEIAPVVLKNPARIEAFFTVYFLALLIQALIERELRQMMKRERLKALPLYPEERRCAHPTTEQVMRLFSHAERHLLSRAGRVVQTFEAEFTPLQRQVLALLGVPASGFRG